MRFLAATCVTLVFSGIVAAQSFEKDVGPLLVRRCLECHSGASPKGKLDLTTAKNAHKGGKSGPALVPGKLAESELWARVDAGEMPPKKPLSDAEKKILRAWIEQGAKWPGPALDLFAFTTEVRAGHDWWSLQPVRRAELPKVKNRDWPNNPIDHFILARLEEKGLTPSSPADRRTLLRRVAFDLLGLPPAAVLTQEEIEAFVNDPKGDAYEKLVDRLLASPHYGERWARHWLDVVRFGESNGFEYDEPRRNAWPYRDWVIQSLNDDLPYDEFIRRQIAGDVLPAFPPGKGDGMRGPRVADVAATGFLVAGGYDTPGQNQQSVAMKAAVRQDELEDIVGAVGQTFLGLTVHCARCHDHKFDPIRQVEYYRLTAALAGVRHGERLMVQNAHDDGPRSKRLAQAQAELKELEAPARTVILEEHKKKPPTKSVPFTPLARWDFTKGLNDLAGSLDARLEGDARQTAEGLVLNGKGHAVTPALTRTLGERTLSAWVKLSSLNQRGGAAISIENSDGQTFDAIVFGEREPGKWLAGSNFFARSLPFGGPKETEADRAPQHLVIVYRKDGSIACYRNGQPYGTETKPASPLVQYRAGEAHILFGLRHSPAEATKLLSGSVTQAELYDRALSAEEVKALAGQKGLYVTEEDIVSKLSPEQRELRKKLKAEIAALAQPAIKPAASGKVYAVLPQSPPASFLLLRGEPGQKAGEVAPAGIAAVGKADFGLGFQAGDAERRRKLADWVTSADNPLLARVMVNRLWHYHFGTGIVETPSDFGFNGGRPSHPELLDWLADEFRSQGYSLKKMHRLIVLSSTYRQSSKFQPAAAKIDAGNRLLWRKGPQRLEAEAVRDAMLAVSGKLDVKMGGPGYKDFKEINRSGTWYYPPAASDDPSQMRRSIYRMWIRGGRNPLLDTLDCPDPSTLTPRRATTTTPLQALALLNGEFSLRMADHWASRLEALSKDVEKQVRLAHEQALTRAPTAAEAAAGRRFVEAHGLRAFCRVLLNCNEFMYVD